MEYSAGNVSNLLWFVETRETMRLLNTDSVDNVMNRVIDENVYQQKDLKRAKRQFNVKCFITALTRQLNKIIILYNQEPYHLLNYSTDANSDIATRFTDLFADVFKDEGPDLRPQIVEVGGKSHEDKLIHRTVRGELVRSKSEVAIANALYYHHIDYEYEPELKLEDKIKRPGFKVEDYDTGVVWYWEHCGMMTAPQYRKRWEDKKKFYEKNGIVEGKNLIVTYDDENGGIDTELIEKIIKDTFDED